MSEDLFNERYLAQRVVVERDFMTRMVAVDRILGREVLITQLQGRVGRRTAVQERFRAAARDAVRLSHAHVVALYDVGSAGGLPYVVQEHTHSEPLVEIIAHEGPFHPDDVAALVEQVAAALDYAQLRNMCHLALSPPVITVDYDGQVLVADFGIGRVLSEISPIDVAKLRYMAPEQLSGQAGDSRSDIFALGAIAYEMLTGTPPFDISSTDALRESISAGRPRALSEVNPDVPDGVSPIVLRALARDPDQRYETAGDFAEALTDWLGNQAPTQPVRSEPFRGVSGSAFGLSAASAPTKVIATPESALETPGDEQEPRSWPRGTAAAAWLVAALALVALVWIGAALIDESGGATNPAGIPLANASPTITTQADFAPTSVPTALSVIGMTLDAASAQTDLQLRVVEREQSDIAPEGEIIRQSPNPGGPVRTGELIVVVSSGPPAEPIQLADIASQNIQFDEVAQQLADLGLNVLQVREGSETVPEGHVIRIDEETARPGNTVHVVTSMGDRVLIPPDVQSQPVEDAVQRMTELGLTVNEPIAVSRQRIESFGIALDDLAIEDNDVVGIQEENAGFGVWVDRDATITPVYYDASLSE